MAETTLNCGLWCIWMRRMSSSCAFVSHSFRAAASLLGPLRTRVCLSGVCHFLFQHPRVGNCSKFDRTVKFVQFSHSTLLVPKILFRAQPPPCVQQECAHRRWANFGWHLSYRNFTLTRTCRRFRRSSSIRESLHCACLEDNAAVCQASNCGHGAIRHL